MGTRVGLDALEKSKSHLIYLNESQLLGCPTPTLVRINKIHTYLKLMQLYCARMCTLDPFRKKATQVLVHVLIYCSRYMFGPHVAIKNLNGSDYYWTITKYSYVVGGGGGGVGVGSGGGGGVGGAGAGADDNNNDL
jgi:hypothetical protein